MNFHHFSTWSVYLVDAPINYDNTAESVNGEDTVCPKKFTDVHIEIRTETDTKIETDTPTKTKSHQFIGYLMISLYLLLWVTSSEVIPMVTTKYDKPYFMRYCVGSFMMMMFPIYLTLNKFKLPKITVNMLWSTCLVSIVLNLSNYFWYISLKSTITAINSTIYESQLVYVYMLSSFILPNYTRTMIKNVSVFVCIAGVVIIGIDSMNDHENDGLSNTAMGIFEVVLASFGLSVFEILVSLFGDKYFKQVREGGSSQFDGIKDMLLFQSLLGFGCFITLWPGLFILDKTGLETFELPQTREDVLGLSVVACIDLMWAASFIIGISLTSPVLMSMSGLLVIPLTFIFDVMFFSLSVSKLTVVGSLLIVIGFVLMECPSFLTKRLFKSISTIYKYVHFSDLSPTRIV